MNDKPSASPTTPTIPQTPRPQTFGFLHWSGALLVTGLVLLLMIVTEPKLSIVWDEGFTLGREARMRAWFQALRDPETFARTWKAPTLELVQSDSVPAPRPDQIDTRAELLSTDVLAWFWPFAREEPHGHPPFYAIVGMIGDVITPHWEVLPRARLGPMLLFSFTAGAIWAFSVRRWGIGAAMAASIAWTVQPNLFANGHYATVDATLTSLWVLAMLCFAQAVEPRANAVLVRPRWLWVVFFGILAGWAADTKLTGWFLSLPCLVWALWTRDRRGLWTLGVGGLVALLTLYAFNPCWWNHPIEGAYRFLVSNLTRAKTIPIPVLFLGQRYLTPRESLPWYNTLVWTVMVTPVGILLLSLLGVRRFFRSSATRSIEGLILLHLGFLLALRALPHTPGHDGVRQFLPAFGVLALVAGVGASLLIGWSKRWGGVLVALAMAEGIVGLALSMPVPLSYFSPIVGGLPGAAKLGMEPTYFWDGLTQDALDWLNENTPEGRRVQFSTFPTSWFYLNQSGRLKPSVYPFSSLPPAWYVLQNRPGAFTELDQEYLATVEPAYVVARSGVPLVWIFPARVSD